MHQREQDASDFDLNDLKRDEQLQVEIKTLKTETINTMRSEIDHFNKTAIFLESQNPALARRLKNKQSALIFMAIKNLKDNRFGKF